jgi:hypothetical protein
MKVYKLEASFEDFEQSYYVTVGLFTDEKESLEIKDKWEKFFLEKKRLLRQFNKKYRKLELFKDIKNFEEIYIIEFDLNKDIFIDNFKYREELTSMMKEFSRDWKLKKIIE